jgi:hypothetical protein
MAHVSVNEGPPEDAPLPELPPEYRRLHASSRGGRLVRALHADCRGLAEFIHEAEQADWAGLGSRDAFIQRCLGRPVDVIELALEGVKLFDLSEPVPIDKAVQAATAKRMAEVQPLAQHGEIGNGRSRHDKIMSTQQGTSADYLAARIKRDRPDIAARVEAGEFKSMRAAAIEAGIVKPPCPVKAGMRAVEKMSEDQRAQFTQWLTDMYGDNNA